MTYTFSYIVDFRGGTYCSQVKSKNLKESLLFWVERLNEQKAEIKFLGDETLKEIASMIESGDFYPVSLQGLKNFWFMQIPTRVGGLYVNIVQTDVS